MSSRYEDYLISESWRLKRQAFLTSGAPHSTQCYVCGKSYRPGFHIHHLTYKRIGAECFEDLVVACNRCHRSIHRLHDERVAAALLLDKRKIPTIESSTNIARDLFRQKKNVSTPPQQLPPPRKVRKKTKKVKKHPASPRMTALRAKKRINDWLRENKQKSAGWKVSHIEFASELSRRIHPRHAWRHFGDKDEALKFIMALAQALPKP